MTPSLYGEYIKEREGYDIYEEPRGFFTYKITGEEMYIRDIFIAPMYRKHGIGMDIFEKVTEIAKQNGCTRLMGTVYPGTNGCSESLYIILKVGFKLFSANNGVVILKKEI